MPFSAYEIPVAIGSDLVVFYFYEEPAYASYFLEPYNHSHICFEAHYIFSGECTLVVEEEKIRLSEGDLFIVKPGKSHSPKNELSTSVHRCCFRFDIKKNTQKARSPALSKEADEILGSFFSIPSYTVLPAGGFSGIMNSVYSELLGNEHGYLTRINGHLLFFLSMTANLLGLRGDRARTKDSPSYTEDKTIAIIDTFFNENYKKYGLENDLAEVLHISRKGLNRLLKEIYNMNFREKLLSTRMGIAMDMLRDTARTNEQIAEALGYRSESAFYTAFKKHFGATPGSCRTPSSAG